MEFHNIDEKESVILSKPELKDLKELITRGKKLLKDLSKDLTYDKLRKLVGKYADKVSKHEEMLENVIKRTLRVKQNLSVHINEIISNTKELVLLIKKASILEKQKDKALKQLEKMLRNYGVVLPLNTSVKYTLGKTRAAKQKIVLNLEQTELQELIRKVIETNIQEIRDEFLINDKDLIQASVIEEFLKKINHNTLRSAVNSNPDNAEFMIKLYVLLNEEAVKIKKLLRVMKDNIKASDEPRLKAQIALTDQELKKVSKELDQAMMIIEKANDKGINTKDLISRKMMETLKKKSSLKSWLRKKFELSDLINQLTYEFLAVYDNITDDYKKYFSYDKLSDFLFAKEFFS